MAETFRQPSRALLFSLASLALAPLASAAPSLTRGQVFAAAKSGQSAEAILKRAYPTGRLVSQKGARVRVLIADNVPRMVLTGRTALGVTDEGQWKHPVQRPLIPDHRYEISRRAKGFALRDLDVPGPLRVFKGPLRVDTSDAATGLRVADPLDRRFRGSLRMVASGASAIQIVNEVALEGYLRAVLAGDIPTDWASKAPTALRAGAIAYRSRTFAKLRGKAFSYDVEADTPVYLGVDGERTETSAAVEESKGLTLMEGPRPIEASFPTVAPSETIALTAEQGAPDQVAAQAPSTILAGAKPGIGTNAARTAAGFLGTPYRWGGSQPGGFDCSGLVSYVYGNLGIKLPRVAADQAKVGESIAYADLQPGDAVFFADSSGYIHHEGIYIGGGQMVHSPHTGDVVKVSDISTGYYFGQFAGARRYSPIR